MWLSCSLHFTHFKSMTIVHFKHLKSCDYTCTLHFTHWKSCDYSALYAFEVMWLLCTLCKYTCVCEWVQCHLNWLVTLEVPRKEPSCGFECDNYEHSPCAKKFDWSPFLWWVVCGGNMITHLFPVLINVPPAHWGVVYTGPSIRLGWVTIVKSC